VFAETARSQSPSSRQNFVAQLLQMLCSAPLSHGPTLPEGERPRKAHSCTHTHTHTHTNRAAMTVPFFPAGPIFVFSKRFPRVFKHSIGSRILQ
jgi:hypothetical protein